MYCLCERCNCNTECEYFEKVVEPIADIINDIAKPMFGEDELTIQIREVLENFECDYFE